jgi:hypothetical protein
MSLIRAWVYGISVFVVMTASFVVAMSIAISGPPSDEEMRQAAAVADQGVQTLASATQRLAAEACRQIPELCSESAYGAPQADRAEPSESEAPPPAAAPVETIVASVETPAEPLQEEASLLGASTQPDAVAPARPARTTHWTSTHRGVPRRPGSHRAPALPPLQARVQGAVSMPTDAPTDIAIVTPTVAHEINHPAPSEDEAAPQLDDPDAVSDPEADRLESDQAAANDGYDDSARHERSGW